MNEKMIKEFWNAHPCGEAQIGGRKGNYEEFFDKYDQFRYARERHILKCLDNIEMRGKSILEIGLGLGADSEQIIRRGALYSGIDLTSESITIVKKRLSLRNLPYDKLTVGSVCSLPFEDSSFDMVFTHGVLHHVPEIQTAQSEIHRVLKPEGELVAMLYAKYSLNYLLSISLLRRAALALMYVSGRKFEGVISEHLENAQKMGILKYLKMQNFIHRNTDGPRNPYSKVYGISEVKTDFPDFYIRKHYKAFMHAPPLPVSGLPLSPLLGWHLWVHMIAAKK